MMMNELLHFLPLVIPVLLIQLGLQIYCIIDLIKRDKVRFDNKIVWALVIIILNLLGPILYLIFSEGD